MEMFYEEVVFRHFGQIPALVRTLENSTVDIGGLIKKIDIRCFIPVGYFSLYQAELRRIFERCPRVVHVNFSVSASPMNSSTDSPRTLCVFKYMALQSVISKLTHLECGEMVLFENLIAGLQLCTNLTSLSFYLPPHAEPAPQQHDAFSAPLVMAELEDLRCVMPWRNTYYLGVIARQWSMPRLRRVSFDQNINVDMSWHGIFFLHHGRNLTYLHIRPHAVILTEQPATVEMQVLLKLCPEVEHIVLSSQILVPISHPKVKWIDIWDPNSAQHAQHEALCASLTQKAFPALRDIRHIDLALANIADVPIVLPPDLVRTGGPLEYQFPGVDIQHTVWRIVKRDMMYHHRDEEVFETSDGFDEGDDGDSESGRHSPCMSLSDDSYRDEESSDDHSSEYWSSGDDESSEIYDWVDHDTALSIFLESQS